MNGNTKKVWITKYALSRGIFERDVSICKAENKVGDNVEKKYYTIYWCKPDWQETELEAIRRAEEMRLKRILSLEKQIQKLKNMTFKKEDSDG